MEYKFRGKGIASNEWYYGDLIIDEGRYYICLQVNDHIKRDDYEVYMIEVIPETIGQYTGLHDKNGKEVFEGDVVEYYDKYKYIVCFGKYNKNPKNCAKAIVIGFYLKEIKTGEIEELYIINNVIVKFPAHCAESEQGIECFKLEVIGNIYDNPELLKEE